MRQRKNDSHFRRLLTVTVCPFGWKWLYARFEARFTARRMAQDDVTLFEQIARRGKAPTRPAALPDAAPAPPSRQRLWRPVARRLLQPGKIFGALGRLRIGRRDGLAGNRLARARFWLLRWGWPELSNDPLGRGRLRESNVRLPHRYGLRWWRFRRWHDGLLSLNAIRNALRYRRDTRRRAFGRLGLNQPQEAAQQGARQRGRHRQIAKKQGSQSLHAGANRWLSTMFLERGSPDQKRKGPGLRPLRSEIRGQTSIFFFDDGGAFYLLEPSDPALRVDGFARLGTAPKFLRCFGAPEAPCPLPAEGVRPARREAGRIGGGRLHAEHSKSIQLRRRFRCLPARGADRSQHDPAPRSHGAMPVKKPAGSRRMLWACHRHWARAVTPPPPAELRERISIVPKQEQSVHRHA
jgi:hypothetical protein